MVTGAAWVTEVNAEVTEIVLTHEGRATITVGEVTGSATDLLTRSSAGDHGRACGPDPQRASTRGVR